MRVLLAHNFYRSAAPSGENQVFEAEVEMLRRHGHEVRAFVRDSDDLQGVLGPLKGALATPWNPFAAARLRRIAVEFEPDVVHVHNTFPLISPAIFRVLPMHVPRVLTLHNYRLHCAAAIPMREGRPCTECLDARSVVPSLRHGCYRGSRAATVPLAASIALHRRLGTWDRWVDAFIALTEFQRARVAGAGLPPERVHVKPNFYSGAPERVPWGARENSAVFAGRLTPEKGADTLVRAWIAWGQGAPDLHVLGSGPERAPLERLAKTGSAHVVFHGQVPAAEVRQHIARAKLVLVPSRWFEGFPMVIAEAYAHGTAVAASNLGPLPSLVRSGATGVVFEAGDAQSLLSVVRSAWASPGALEQLGAGARAEFESAYTEDVNHRTLVAIYGRARHAAARRSPRAARVAAEPGALPSEA